MEQRRIERDELLALETIDHVTRRIGPVERLELLRDRIEAAQRPAVVVLLMTFDELDGQVTHGPGTAVDRGELVTHVSLHKINHQDEQAPYLSLPEGHVTDEVDGARGEAIATHRRWTGHRLGGLKPPGGPAPPRRLWIRGRELCKHYLRRQRYMHVVMSTTMPTTRFTTLVLSLPSPNKTERMRVWRALRSMGCGVLRDGVYLLPEGASQAARFIELESEVTKAGGFAMTVEVDVKTSTQFERVRKLFDRTPDFSQLVQEVESVRRSLRRIGAKRAATAVKRLRQTFKTIGETDFFPGQAGLQAEEALTSLEREWTLLQAPGEPRARRSAMPKIVNAKKFQKRLWASRQHPWVDRLASAWLIKRFIDKQARFAWLEDVKRRPKTSVGFDFDGAEFSHSGHRVTFETMLASFSLEDDAALKRMASTVHYLDVGGIPVGEADGIRTILEGIREKARSDDELVLEALRVFDHVYAAWRPKEHTP